MTELATLADHGVVTEPATVEIRRLLPGPIERCWAWLTDSELRRQWLAAGDMEMKAGTSFEFVWRNDELTDPPGQRPEGFSAEHRAQMRMIELDPPHSLTFEWPDTGHVTFALEPRGDQVELTVTHRRIPNRRTMVGVSAGWHRHLDVLAAKAAGETPAPFWDGWAQLRADYDARLPV